MTSTAPVFTPATPPVTPRWAWALLIALLIAYWTLGTAYALRTPPWQSPDEPAHYNYSAQLAAQGCCPVIALGDWDQAYLSQLTASRFAPELLGNLAAIQYEDHQPPLYYGLTALVFQATDGSLTALRLTSVLLGTGILLAAFAVARWLAPERPAFALLTAGIAAFIPQQMSVLGSVNNDALAFALVGAAYVLLVVYVRRGLPTWALGGVVGLALLTKISTIFLIGLVPLVIVLTHWFVTPRRLVDRTLIVRLLGFFVPALGLAGLWWVRNISVYGGLDIFGLGAHDAVVIGQLRTADYLAQIGPNEYVRALIVNTFNSYWGQFGWMAAPMTGEIYTLILIALALVLVGGALRLLTDRQRLLHTPERRIIWAGLGIALIVGFAQYGYYNTSFVQFQGRYLLPAALPFALLLAWGWEGLVGVVVRWLPTPLSRAVSAGLLAVPVLALLLLNGWVLWRVLPWLAPGAA